MSLSFFINEGCAKGLVCSAKASVLPRSSALTVPCNHIYIYIFMHNKELNDLYTSPNILRVIKSRRMRWAGHVARVDEERGV